MDLPSPQMMISRIYTHVKEHGTLSGIAKSKWGQDCWELNGIKAVLQDEGYTQGVMDNFVSVRDTHGHENLLYLMGTEQDLINLYNRIFPPQVIPTPLWDNF